jgi:multiple sugar transport system permease protein
MAILPLFIVMVWVQSLLHVTITGTFGSVIIAYLTFSLPLVTWLVKSYVENIPIELEEAARLDGAGAFRVLSRVVLPIAAPAAVVAAVLAFLTGWGDLLVATILTGPSSQTVTVALNTFLNVQESSTTVPAYGMLLAASVVSALPVVVIFLGMQRFFVAGLAGSAMKG